MKVARVGGAIALIASIACPALAQHANIPAGATQLAGTPALVATSPSIEGLTTGGPTSTLDAKCRTPGVTCQKFLRKYKGQTLERTRVTLPAASAFSSVTVITKGGTILALTGRYRKSEDRLGAMKAAFGQPVRRGNNVAFALPNGVVAMTDARLHKLHYVDTRAATSKGITLTQAQMLAPVVRKVSVRPELLDAVSGPVSVAPGRLSQAAIDRMNEASFAPVAIVDQPLRIPVSFTLLELACYVEDDPTSIIWGDTPRVQVDGVHTSFPQPWTHAFKYDSVESGDVVHISSKDGAVFDPSATAQRSVGLGEAVGVEMTLLEEDDLSYDDEIDFGFAIVDYAFAVANQGKSIPKTEYLIGDGAQYTLTYQIDIGRGVAEPAANRPPTVYRDPNVRAYAGHYEGFIGSSAASLDLTHLASVGASHPNGTFYGTLTEGGVASRVYTKRLQGNALELIARASNGTLSTLAIYLSGDATHAGFRGSKTAPDGSVRGAFFDKK